MIGIYKFTNKINNKIYIGQSKSIETRYKRHLYDARKGSKTIFHRALVRYGINNFIFEVIEECDISKLDEREKYYIKQYNSLMPNGYNMQTGGTPSGYQPYFSFSTDTIYEIYDLITNTEKTFSEIGEEFGVTSTMISYINLGKEYAQDGVEYPIRSTTTTQQLQKQIVAKKLSGENSYRCTISEQTAYDIIYDLTFNLQLTSVDIAKKYHTTIDVVKDINRGKSWKYIYRDKPCRPDFGNHKISLDDALFIIQQLKNPRMSFQEIADLSPNYTIRIVYRINQGETWKQPNEKYPINSYRYGKGKLKKSQVEQIIIDLQLKEKTIQEIAQEYGITSQSISDINWHRSYPYLSYDLSKPIRY